MYILKRDESTNYIQPRLNLDIILSYSKDDVTISCYRESLHFIFIEIDEKC